jgi:hydrogenase expression/formation protein HypD
VNRVEDLRGVLRAIADLPLGRPVRVMHLCGDHERVIALSDMRQLLPRQVDLVAGPGCAASVCPEEDLRLALRLVERREVTLMVSDNLLRLPLSAAPARPRSLYEARRDGADIRVIEAPIEAVMAARDEPQRECVMFVAGFETLLAPLAGMVLDGLPPNLSLLLCGRRSEPLIEQLLAANPGDFDALLLPGTRCALTGTADWDCLATRFRKPAAVAGYSTLNILTALHAVLRQLEDGVVRVDNCYRRLASREGDALAQDRLERVFERADGDWRGLGAIPGTGFRLRRTYDNCNARVRFGEARVPVAAAGLPMPAGCECAAVVVGHRLPVECPQFTSACTPRLPYGPCMASQDGTCFLHRDTRHVA